MVQVSLSKIVFLIGHVVTLSVPEPWKCETRILAFLLCVLLVCFAYVVEAWFCVCVHVYAIGGKEEIVQLALQIRERG